VGVKCRSGAYTASTGLPDTGPMRRLLTSMWSPVAIGRSAAQVRVGSGVPKGTEVLSSCSSWSTSTIQLPLSKVAARACS
jgi:hypothetical protein